MFTKKSSKSDKPMGFVGQNAFNKGVHAVGKGGAVFSNWTMNEAQMLE